jgi:hypothetical protein
MSTIVEIEAEYESLRKQYDVALQKTHNAESDDAWKAARNELLMLNDKCEAVRIRLANLRAFTTAKAKRPINA